MKICIRSDMGLHCLICFFCHVAVGNFRTFTIQSCNFVLSGARHAGQSNTNILNKTS